MRISENRPQVLAPKCYCRAQTSDEGKYRGNNVIGEDHPSVVGQAYCLEILYERVGHFSPMVVGNARGLPLHVFHQSIKVVARIGNADHSNCGAIPQAAGLKLGDRYVKAAAKAVFYATHHLTFILE